MRPRASNAAPGQAAATTKQPNTEQPNTKQPTTKQPIATTEQPTTKQPTTKQPTTKLGYNPKTLDHFFALYNVVAILLAPIIWGLGGYGVAAVTFIFYI